jgi:hypothetical protein
MLQLRNKQEFLRKLERVQARVEQLATQHVRAKVIKLYELVLTESPQYSGDFAANWRIDLNNGPARVGAPVGLGTYVRTGFKDLYQEEWLPPKQAGHPDALRGPLHEFRNDLQRIDWGTQVIIYNRTPIAFAIKSGDMRPEYRPVHEHLQGLAFVTYIKQKYTLKG